MHVCQLINEHERFKSLKDYDKLLGLEEEDFEFLDDEDILDLVTKPDDKILMKVILRRHKAIRSDSNKENSFPSEYQPTIQKPPTTISESLIYAPLNCLKLVVSSFEFLGKRPTLAQVANELSTKQQENASVIKLDVSGNVCIH